MHPGEIVVMLERVQLAHQIRRVPEEHTVEGLAPDRADQAFDKGMRNRRVRNRLDRLDFEDAQVGEPAVCTGSDCLDTVLRFRRPCAKA
jgi:hypothetical protein